MSLLGEQRLCAFRWPLDEPNEEDRRNGTTHRCAAPEGHEVSHRCGCGAYAFLVGDLNP